MLDKEGNKPRGISSFVEGLFAPLHSKKSNHDNHQDQYRITVSHIASVPSIQPVPRHSTRFVPYTTPTLNVSGTRGQKRNSSVATPIYDSYVPRHKPMMNCNGFRQVPSKQFNQLESVDIDALDEYKNFLKDLNAGKNASPFDRFSTPMLPQRPMRLSAAAVSGGTQSVHACSPNTMLSKITSTLEMLRNLPKLVDEGSKMLKSNSVVDGYNFLDSAPSPKNALARNIGETKSQLAIIDLTEEIDKTVKASGDVVVCPAKDGQVLCASTSVISPISLKLPMYHPMQADNRCPMDTAARTWRERKYMDEEEQRMASIRDLQKEIDLRSMARNNRQILNEEHRRLKLSMEGLILERRAPEREEFPELPEDCMELLKNAWDRSSPQNEVFTKGFGVDILRKDLLSLRGLEWLNDEIINFYMNLICERSKNDAALPKTYAFSTFFYASLSSKGYTSVKRWTRKLDVFSYDLLIIPVHLTAHWCLATIDFKQKVICYFDSLLGENDRCLKTLEEYLKLEYTDKKKKNFDMSGWSLVCRKDIPQQLNGSDCGMFTCKFAEYVSRRAAITFDQSRMPYFRQRMVYEVVSQTLL